ncbi:MAG: PQQ-dependent sugar dehydrogenase [Myxococcota bacterium]|nr:PQQ-dependent sugar dehydrogenase [Myxococcota bacterium]
MFTGRSICWASVAVFLVSMMAASAEARTATVRWTDPNPAPSPVTNFRLYVGTSPGVFAAGVDLGLPVPDSQGIFSVEVVVPESEDLFFAMSALEGSSLESDLSNEQSLPSPPPADEVPIGQIDQPTAAVSILVGQGIQFESSGSDPDGGLVAFLWNFDGVASGVPDQAVEDPGWVTFPQVGVFTVRLVLTDDEGNVTLVPGEVVVDVQSVPEPPSPPEPEPPSPPPVDYNFEPAGLRLTGEVGQAPLTATGPPDDSRLFVATPSGEIRILEGGYPRTAPFLDFSDERAQRPGAELLGLAFDPEYAVNGRFFVTRLDAAGDWVLSRFLRGDNPYQADPESEVVLLRVPLSDSDQPGGGLAFDSEGFLFVGIGDGGGVGDPGNYSQDPMALRGKLLRLDVSVPAMAGSIPVGAYAIPSDNPFVEESATRSEIWALGLRDPRRLGVDLMTGDLWITDPSSGLREEVNFESGDDPGGHNYGWDVTSGTLCNGVDPSSSIDCDDPGLTDPILEYEPTEAACGIMGGHVYRGAHTEFQGEYFFVDGCSGNVWSYDRESDELRNRNNDFASAGTWTAPAVGIGQGGTGELFVLTVDGGIHRISGLDPACSDGVDNDADGLVDYPNDPGCASALSEWEVPLCDDGFDNDLDGEIDTEDGECSDRSRNIETDSVDLRGVDAGDEIFCGLGAEVAFILPFFMQLRRAGRRFLRARG